MAARCSGFRRRSDTDDAFLIKGPGDRVSVNQKWEVAESPPAPELTGTADVRTRRTDRVRGLISLRNTKDRSIPTSTGACLPIENPYMCNNECDASTEELAHPPELMFDFEGRNPTTFWQSSSWKKYPRPLQVNITLSWNKTVELTDDIVITFESGRPEQMVLEKSLDYGRTWQPYQFYATDCLDAFIMEPKTVHELTQQTLLDIICTEDYSRGYVWKYDKTVRFEIKDRFALFAGPRLHNMASLPATGATMVDEYNLSRYFYAISDIKVQGRCKCNLHANSCVFDKDKLTCECEHNTTGPDCGRCKKNYQGRAWSVGSYLPIPKGTANICIANNLGPVIRPNVSSLGVANRNQEGKSSEDRRRTVRGQTAPDDSRDVGSLSSQLSWLAGVRVCDNLMMRCQNGGVCHNNQRCHCPSGFSGLLCEKPRCESEAGGCPGAKSGQAALLPPGHVVKITLLMTAVASLPHRAL
ncbi:hypothetical protein SKAU_G00199440 [Synaphobranchus kaupii]|uniref:Netrin G1 n=1 Tax=Synaphobranchus kaupii TaxID=118154 RepID=A0A9Q1FF63_SYNKA|nr:hypothetical protein SKAU_G00199440 [Synaphobranchus kaupii]